MSFNFNINPQSNSLKYIQLVDAIASAISEGALDEGDMLPSVNELVKNASLSRDTIFKAYTELKNRGIVESVPNRGYFVTRQLNRVLLFLDTFKAYKEVLYDGFRANLPENVSVDLMFHHYNIKVFENILTDSIGKYSHYIVMNFDHPEMKRIISNIPSEKLLIIDWNIHAANEHSYVCQDFGSSVFENFTPELERIKKYKRFVFLYPNKLTFHPKTTITNFIAFCKQHKITHEVIYDVSKVNLKKGDLYLLVSDRTLTKILDEAHNKHLETGKDIGIVSYNETPLKKYVKDGISVLSTNFTEMGEKAAEYVLNPGEMRYEVKTKLILRKSF